MLEKYQSFFAENGITSTSANHLCNVAREYVANAKADISRIRFVKISVSSLNADIQPIVLNDAVDDTAVIVESLDKIAKANAFVAYMQEAIKAKNAAFAEIERMPISTYYKEHDIELPDSPTRGDKKSFEDFFSELDIKAKAHYYALEAKAAIIGKTIHPGGSFHEARQQMFEAFASPAYIEGDKVYHRNISVLKDDVEEVYFELQKKHRAIEAELNSIKNSIELKVKEHNAAVDAEYSKKYSEYATQVQSFTNDFTNWKNAELKRINKLKIAIPDSLKETYDFLSNL